MESLESYLSSATDGYAETLIDVNSISESQLTGRFVSSDGRVCDFEMTPSYIEYGESPHTDSGYVNEYFSGVLFANGVEYHGDSAYD